MVYIYIYIFIYLNIHRRLGVLVRPGNSVRFVRASEAACGRGTLLLPWRDFKSSKNVPAGGRAPPPQRRAPP